MVSLTMIVTIRLKMTAVSVAMISMSVLLWAD